MNRVAIGLAALLVPGVAAAAEDETARAARWQDLKHAVFGEREVVEHSGVIALEAPGRALDAALVPVTVTLPGAGSNPASGKVSAVWLLVDGNPSPLAGTFRFGSAADARMLKTRVRVDQYTLIHAVAETADGRLFATDQYVKAAGGCSAPSSKDAKLAMSRLGQMKLRVDEAASGDGVVTAQLLISHPNNNGMQVDQVSHNFIPARYIQEIAIRQGGRDVLTVEADISLTEDPAITFAFRPEGDGAVQVEMVDSSRGHYRREFPVSSRQISEE